MKKENSFDSKKLINDVKNLFEAFPTAEANYRQVAAELGIEDKKIKELVKGVLSQLLNTHFLLSDKRGKYRLNPKQASKSITNKQYITGVVDMKQTGKAYVICEGMDDVLITANNTGKALDGDTVKVLLFPCRKGKKQEGQIVEVVKRAKVQFVGRLQLSDKCAFVIPDAGSMPVDLFIPMDLVHGAKDGEKVVAKLTEWHERSKNPFGEIIHVLGKPGENNVEMQSILIEYDFPLSFSDEAEREAENVSDKISDEEIGGRRDFRKVFTMTIDPADAKDFDDAISYRILENGNFEIGVHIADVSYYVRPGSAIDKEAYERATSVYLVDRVIPMLPEKLSNFVCSLRPAEEKLCFSAVFEMNGKGELLSRWFGRTVIDSDVRFAYEDAQAIIEGGGDGKYKKQVLQLWNLASKLREKRFKKGAIDFESQEVKFRLDDTGRPIGVYIKEQKEANHLIEEFMLLANMCVAEHVGNVKDKSKAKTFVYRIHDQPNPEKINQFAEFVKKLGYKIKMNDRSSLVTSMNKLFKDVSGKGEENMINQIAVRTMSKAIYSTDNIGHYGLAFDFYTHFTSPIRRYPDLMVHRLLAEYLDNKPSADKEFYEACCVHSSVMEKKAADAERSSIKLKQAEYLIDRVGEMFDGVISGVSKWGIYVELNDNKCEGMVRLRDLQDDFYYLDEENYQVIGQRYGNKYKLGDPVKIKVKNVDLQRKQIDFAF